MSELLENQQGSIVKVTGFLSYSCGVCLIEDHAITPNGSVAGLRLDDQYPEYVILKR